MRYTISLILSIIISIAIFILMQKMTSTNNKIIENENEPIQLIYLRDKIDTNIEKKQRIKPKEPVKKVEKQKLELKMNLNKQLNKNVKIEPLKINQNIDISSISSLNGAKVDFGTTLLDANMLTTLKRVNPRYPRTAKIKRQEGFVQLTFKIDYMGFVSEVQVVASNPKGVFENEAIKAIKKWQFKPSKNNNHDNFSNATITFNFRLAR